MLGRRRQSRRHERQRRARLDVLPVVPPLVRPGVRRGRGQGPRTHPAQGVQRLARPVVVRQAPGPFHPDGPRAVLGHRPHRRRGRAPRGAGRARGVVLREPVEARSTESARRALGPVLGGVPGPRDRAVPAHRIVIDHHRHRARRAVRRDRDAAADEHRRGRGRPRVVADPAQVPEPADRAVRGRRRLAPLLPRQDRPRVPQAVGVDPPGLRRRAAERHLQGADRHVLHRRPGHP